MIDPGRRVANLRTVDHPPITEIEEKGILVSRGRSLVSTLRFSADRRFPLCWNSRISPTRIWVTAKTPCP